MAGDESLFSLEVIVESIENIYVSCYKPAIAFRLLDFPTVMIRSELQEVCANEISYEIQSGKSCLFKMSKEMLCERLQDTPLYIMLVDISSTNTKLLASTTISLVNCFQNILANIENNGFDIPAVSGSNGEYEMYNLMGSQVATVKLGYRMFSFGAGITGHVNISLSKQIKRNDKENILTKSLTLCEQPGKANICIKASPPQTEHSTTGNKTLLRPNIVDKNRTLQADGYTQTDSINTKQQCVTPPQKHNNPESLGIHHHNNISRPPPLYYNSTSAFAKPRMAYVPSGRPVRNSNDESTRPRMSASLGKSVKSPNKETNSRPQYCDSSVQTCETSHNRVPTQQDNASTQCLNDNQLSLPLIEALLNELSLVRTKYVNNNLPQQIYEGSTPPCKTKQVKIHEADHVPSNKAQDQKTKMKKVAQQAPRKSDIKFKPTRDNSKGVLIYRHPMKFKKSSLKYGTTKTQKLREAISKKNKHGEQNIEPPDSQDVGYLLPEQMREEFLRQDSTMQNDRCVEQKSKQILRENKATMTQSSELECKDIGVQVRISDDNFPSTAQKYLSQGLLLGNDDGLSNVILGATYINDTIPVSAMITTNQADNNTDELLGHTYPRRKEVEEPLSSNKLLSNPGEVPTFSHVSPTVPMATNMRYSNSNSERSSKESQEKSLSSDGRLSDKSLRLASERSSKESHKKPGSSDSSLGLVNKPVGDVRSNGERSSKDSLDKSISSDSRLSDKSLGVTAVSKPVGEVLSKSSYSDNFDSDASDHTDAKAVM